MIERMYTHCGSFNNIILYPLVIRKIIIEECTLSAILGVISSSLAWNIKDNITGVGEVYIFCNIVNNIILSPPAY